MKCRKIIAAVLILTAATLLLTGCGSNRSSKTSSGSGSSSSSSASAPEIFETDYGKFEVPEGWVKNEEHSTDAKPFFVSEDYDGSGVPDNISVEFGTNPYSKDQSADFGRAILQQLSTQAGSNLDGSITSSGSATKTGETLLTFEIPMKDRTCRQYYIVGDRQYVMVYETNFDGSESCDEAAETIVNTFEWK